MAAIAHEGRDPPRPTLNPACCCTALSSHNVTCQTGDQASHPCKHPAKPLNVPTSWRLAIVSLTHYHRPSAPATINQRCSPHLQYAHPHPSQPATPSRIIRPCPT